MFVVWISRSVWCRICACVHRSPEGCRSGWHASITFHIRSQNRQLKHSERTTAIQCNMFHVDVPTKTFIWTLLSCLSIHEPDMNSARGDNRNNMRNTPNIHINIVPLKFAIGKISTMIKRWLFVSCDSYSFHCFS